MTLARFKKYISLALLFVILFSFLPERNIAMAQAEIGFINAGLLGGSPTGIPVQDKASIWQRIIKYIKDSWYQIQDTITQKSIVTKEYVLDPIAWTMANVIIDQFGDALVDWIRNGFDGSPMFLSDPEGFFRDTANQISGAIIDDLDMEWLCDPLGKLHINLEFFFPGTDRTKFQCTFEDIANVFASYADRDDLSDWISVDANLHERNIVREFGNDYRNGGFLMWLMTAQKKNNDLGRTLQTANEAYMAASVSVGSEKFQLNLYKGFFGVRKCVEYVEGGELIGMTSEGKNAGKPPCKKWETKTPGTLVQDQLDDVGGKDLSRLQVADEIDEIIGALATTMMGWMLTGGNDDGGVLGYDSSDKDYAGSQRDHYGELSNRKKLRDRQQKISSQLTAAQGNENNYTETLNSYADSLYGAKENLNIILSKLECIYATSTADKTYDYSICDDNVEKAGKNLADNGKTSGDVSNSIDNVESAIASTESRSSDFNSKYGANATSTSALASETMDEFETAVYNVADQSELEDAISQYGYSYDKNNKTITIEIANEDGTASSYTTHTERNFTGISKEAANISGKMDNLVLKHSCALNDYTGLEDVSQSECGSFESSSSSAEESGSSSSE